MKTSAYTNAQSRFASIVLVGVLEPPRLAQQALRIVSLQFQKQHLRRVPLEGRCVISKRSSRVWGRDKGVARRNGRWKCFPDEDSKICPRGKSMIFYLSGLPNIWLHATPLLTITEAKSISFSRGLRSLSMVVLHVRTYFLSLTKIAFAWLGRNRTMANFIPYYRQDATTSFFW